MDSSDVCTPPQSTLPTLFVAGLLNGAPLNVKPVDLGGRVWVVALEDGDWATVRDWRGGERGVMAVKKITGGALPQDGLNEARLLARMDHPNVLALYDAYLVPLSLSSPASTLQLFTPYYAHPLSALLASPAASEPRVATALVAQMLDAVLFIHAEGIAHRDVGTPNFVVGSEGRVVLIDFGISLDRSEVSGTLGYIQELPGAMHFEVGTGPYRAPELLFGSRDYDPFALDLWALGTVIAEFYTPLQQVPTSPASSRSGSPLDDDDDGHETPWTRATLFNGSRSELALIGSIFRELGSPTRESWPEGELLSQYTQSRAMFTVCPPTSLESHLPHLDVDSPVLKIINGLVAYSAAARTKAADARRLLAGEPLLEEGPELGQMIALVRGGRSLES